MIRPAGTYIVPVLHPAALMRSQTLQFATVEAWKKAVRIQREGPTVVPRPFEEWQMFPTLERVESYFRAAMTGDDPGPWSIDFEATIDPRVVCMSVWSCTAPLRHRGLVVPFILQGDVPYWKGDEATRVLDIVCQFLEASDVLKIGQNIVGYDTGFGRWNTLSLLRKAWDVEAAGILGDIMVAHHTCFPELRHSLAFQGAMGTDLHAWKVEIHEKHAGEARGRLAMLDAEADVDDVVAAETEEDDDADDWARILEKPSKQVFKYALYDAFVPAVVWPQLKKEMAP